MLASALVVVLAAGPTPGPFAARSIIPFVVAGSALVTGAIVWGISEGQTERARTLTGSEREALEATATNNRVGGVLLMSAGALVAAIGLFVVFFEPDARPSNNAVQLSLAPFPGGGAAVLSGRWP